MRFDICKNPAFMQAAGNIGNKSNPEYLIITSLEDGNEITFGENTYSEYLNDLSAIKDGEPQDISTTILLNSGEELIVDYSGVLDQSNMALIFSGQQSIFEATKKTKLSGTAKPIIIESDGVVVKAYSGFFKRSNVVNADELYIEPAMFYVNMFFECSELKRINMTSIPAVISNNEAVSPICSRMFWDCSSLEVAPELPATILQDGCYSGMFKNCSSLEVAPELPAKSVPGSTCYANMFDGCTSLNKVTCLLEDTLHIGTYSWLDGVSPTGTFIKAAGVEWPTGAKGIPEGWTVQDYAG